MNSSIDNQKSAIQLSATDRKVLAALTRDGRASVKSLATDVGVSRTTVQASLNRLLDEKVIQRFTIDVDPVAGAEVIRAVTTIKVEGNQTSAIIARLRNMPEVVSLHSTNGAWDLVAQIEAASLFEFDRILTTTRQIPGVLNSETSILLSAAK